MADTAKQRAMPPGEAEDPRRSGAAKFEPGGGTPGPRSVADLRSGSAVDRQFRLATLNLLEDAAAAQRQVERAAAEKAHAEQCLRENEEQFRRALEDAPIPVIMFAEDGQVLQVSRSWSDLTTLELADIPTFESWLGRLSASDRQAARSGLRELFAGRRRAHEAELKLEIAPGATRSWIFSLSSPGRLRDGRRFAVGMAIDITERAVALEALRESEEHLSAIFSRAEVGISEISAEGRFLRVNDTLCRILGRSRDVLLRSSVKEVTVPDDWSRSEAMLETLLGTGQPVSLDKRYARPDGSVVWANSALSRLPGRPGRPPTVLAVTTDLTERRLAEEAMRDADRRKSEFIAVLGHELRNPLSAIAGGIQLLQSNRVTEASRAAALPVVAEQVQHMQRLIDDVLDVARISQGKLQVRMERIALQAAVQQAVAMVGESLASKSCELRIDLPEEPVMINADRVRLAQVFVNLLSNAVKYSSPGGEIVVHARVQHGEVSLSVRDRGIGIAPDLLPHVFDVFVQAKRALDLAGGGLGLGLSVVRQLVEAQGGRVYVRSEGEDKGSEFIVVLPCAEG